MTIQKKKAYAFFFYALILLNDFEKSQPTKSRHFNYRP